MFFECARKKIIGKPCEGEPHARFEVAGDGNGNTAPLLDPTKNFYPARLPQGHWMVILDGTGLYHFHERHCENCLVKEVTDKEGKKKKVYSHHVLESKLVLADNIIISLGTEFIENESEGVTKQDCEINASKRLMKKIKGKFP